MVKWRRSNRPRPMPGPAPAPPAAGPGASPPAGDPSDSPKGRAVPGPAAEDLTRRIEALREDVARARADAEARAARLPPVAGPDPAPQTPGLQPPRSGPPLAPPRGRARPIWAALAVLAAVGVAVEAVVASSSHSRGRSATPAPSLSTRPASTAPRAPRPTPGAGTPATGTPATTPAAGTPAAGTPATTPAAGTPATAPAAGTPATAPATAAAPPAGTAPTPSGPPAAGSGGTASASPVSVTVRAGQSFWSIATSVVASRVGTSPTAAQVGPYWASLVAANAARLPQPGNPDLIYPGQTVTLPHA